MEKTAVAAYFAWTALNTDETRTLLFTTINALTEAVILVGKYRSTSLNIPQAAYDYTITLYERLVTGRMKFGPAFPLQKYIATSIGPALAQSSEVTWQETLETVDLDAAAEQFRIDPALYAPEPRNTSNLTSRSLSERIFHGLTMFYSVEEIARLTPITVDLILRTPHDLCHVAPLWPVPIRDFAMTLIAITKRVSEEEHIVYTLGNTGRKKLKHALKTATKSTLFMSAVLDPRHEFARELCLALDADSLYRLCAIAGGTTIAVPSLETLDQLMASVSAMGEVLLENHDLKDMATLLPTIPRANAYIDRAIKFMKTFPVVDERRESQPLINVLASSVQALDLMLKELATRITTESSHSLVERYCELNQCFGNFAQALYRITDALTRDDAHGS